MLPEMELFQYIYKTADMGCQGIDTVEEHAEKRLREELRRERQEYRAIRDEADGHIRRRGDTPAGVGTVARVSAEWMSKGQLAMDDSRGKIAELMIQGTTMGIVKTIRHLNDYQGDDGDARRLGERLLDTQEQNVERMKAYHCAPYRRHRRLSWLRQRTAMAMSSSGVHGFSFAKTVSSSICAVGVRRTPSASSKARGIRRSAAWGKTR